MSSQWSISRAVALAVSIATFSTVSPASAGTFDGRWVLVQRLTTSASVPVVGDIEAKTTVVSVHDLRSDDGRLKGTGTLCDIDVDSGSDLVSTILPAAFRKVMPPPEIDALIDVQDGVLLL
ncbi:MAG: hypothetical protein JNK04_18125, partial [Myxococcales bacterium]|nr:hypothetical protein [Myxococcales bacterium]